MQSLMRLLNESVDHHAHFSLELFMSLEKASVSIVDFPNHCLPIKISLRKHVIPQYSLRYTVTMRGASWQNSGRILPKTANCQAVAKRLWQNSAEFQTRTKYLEIHSSMCTSFPPPWRLDDCSKPSLQTSPSKKFKKISNHDEIECKQVVTSQDDNNHIKHVSDLRIVRL